MLVLFTLLFLLSIVGIIYPRIYKKIVRRVFKRWVYIVATVVFFILILVSTPDTDTLDEAASRTDKPAISNASSPSSIKEASAKDEEKAKKEADKKAKKEAEEKAKAEEAAAAKAKAAEEEKQKEIAAKEAAKNPKWDMAEVDATESGNLPLGIKMLEAIGNQPVTPKNVKAGSVFKAPWNYYGTPIAYTVTVTIVEDYPPKSDYGKNGINAQVVGTADDGTILDILSTSNSGDIQVGDEIKITAYTVGKFTVKNKLGGQTDQLALITNKL
ncbi:hypothetical protein ACFSR7_36445 [Cohnella sp. GCM10020058]|uniref:hypothetical protein n=1 Tax=Cohnella sp. GCM10020058 TaxID=3317330 RepID=UPI003638F8A7